MQPCRAMCWMSYLPEVAFAYLLGLAGLAADSTTARQRVFPGMVVLTLTHPVRGMLTTIQACTEAAVVEG
jgi:hypothetical protein